MAGTIITVAQQKGGAGKTTLTAHLAVAFKDAGKSVALVDIDPQQSLSNWFRLRQELYEVAGQLVDLAAAAPALGAA